MTTFNNYNFKMYLKCGCIYHEVKCFWQTIMLFADGRRKLAETKKYSILIILQVTGHIVDLKGVAR